MTTDGNRPARSWRLHAVGAVAVLGMVLIQFPSAASGLSSLTSAAPWTSTEAQLPANAGTNPAATYGAVSCPSVGFCVAVGDYTDTSNYQYGVIDVLSGSTWAATQAPEPANAGTDAETTQYAHLYGVSCTSSGTCVAVGTYRDAGGYNHGLIETMSGGSWAATKASEPSNSAFQSAYLESVSCASRGACTAVGFYIDTSGSNYGLIDTLSGRTWAATQAPEPANSGTDADGEQNALLYSVSCSPATSCAAMGHYTAASGAVYGLIDTLSGGTWVATEAPEPPNASSSNPIVSLISVSCHSGGSCSGVGQYRDTGAYYYGLIETLSGGTWTATEAPEPANAGTETSGTEMADFDSVACRSAGSCVAVGFYDDTSGFQYGLIDTLSGGAWSATEAPEPANGGNGYAQLYGVSCGSAASCVAVGNYYDASFLLNGLIDTLSGGTWIATEAPEPANAGTDADSRQRALLSPVSCPTAAFCAAMGYYEDTNGSQQGLLEVHWSRPTIRGLSPMTGPTAGGTTVTITGTNFTGATSVVFGTRAATNLVVVSSTEITVTAPAHGAGTVAVRATTPGGESAEASADKYTYS